MNPFELYDYLAFTGVALVAFVVGRKTSHPKPPPPLRPICSCEHGYGFHDNGQRCNATIKGRRNYSDVVDNCKCMRYDGPDPTLFGLNVD